MSENPRLATVLRAGLAVIILAVVIGILVGRGSGTGEDAQVTSLGGMEVTARLTEIRGKFPPNDLYDYAYVLKYHVLEFHRGEVDGNEILVAQYNPLKPRSKAQDEFSGTVGGNLTKFRAGDIHRMALEAPLADHYMGGILDEYYQEKGVRYWAVWTNLVRQ